jgi:hypothetical protein
MREIEAPIGISPPASMQDTPREEDELCQPHIRSTKRGDW